MSNEKRNPVSLQKLMDKANARTGHIEAIEARDEALTWIGQDSELWEAWELYRIEQKLLAAGCMFTVAAAYFNQPNKCVIEVKGPTWHIQYKAVGYTRSEAMARAEAWLDSGEWKKTRHSCTLDVAKD